MTLNLGVRYDLQFPFTDPQDRKLAFVPGAEVARSTRPRRSGCCSPATPASAAASCTTDINNIAPRLGVAWDPKGDGRMAVRAAFGMFYGSITGNEWNTTADNQPFTVRQSFPTVFTLSDPYRNLPGGVGPFPFNYTPASRRASRCRRRCSVRRSISCGRSATRRTSRSRRSSAELQRERVVRRVARRGISPASVDSNYPVFDAGARRRRTSTRVGRIMPGTIGAGDACS